MVIRKVAVETIVSGLKSMENSASRKVLGKGKSVTEVVAGVREMRQWRGVGVDHSHGQWVPKRVFRKD